MRKYGLVAGVGAFTLGILLSCTTTLGEITTPFTLCLGLSMALFLFVRNERNSGLLLLVCTIFFVLGIARTEGILSSHASITTLLEENVGEEVVFEGVLIAEPDMRENTTRYVARVQVNATMSTNVLVIAPHYPTFSYGDKLALVGTLEEPEDFEVDSGRVFPYRSWLLSKGITHSMYFPTITYVSSGNANPVKARLFVLKQAFLDRIEEKIPEPEAALGEGLLVGERRALGDQLLHAFQITGVIHIVVLSGYNVTIIAEAIRTAFRFLPLLAQTSVSAILIILFAMLTGGGSTIVRATIMGLLVMFARATGNVYAITRALFFAGFLMLLWNPLSLLYDPSFQLSFIATLGLIYIAPMLEPYVSFIPVRFGFREFATATIATQLAVLPLLLYLVGTLSLVAVPTNMLVLLAVPLAMLFTFLTGITGFFIGIVGNIFAYVAYVLLGYQIAVVEFFAELPMAAVAIPPFPFWIVLLAYVLGITIVCRNWLHTNRKHPK